MSNMFDNLTIFALRRKNAAGPQAGGIFARFSASQTCSSGSSMGLMMLR